MGSFRNISEDAVVAATGKGWGEWLRLLDEWSMKERGHTATAAWLHKSYGVSPWWAQVVTIRYEWERGWR